MAKAFSTLQGKRIMITGGTGSFGNEMIASLIGIDAEIIVYSRDEKKQHEMFLAKKNPNVKFVIGDIRDRDKLRSSMMNCDFVFHAAALKHVPVGEQFPEEVIATNILGTKNVLDLAERCGVSKVINISTDKACEPINAYGMTKALAEKLVNARSESATHFVNLRYGNVLGSRGSVVPLFMDQIAHQLPLTITDGRMTRFLMPLAHAVLLVDKCVRDGETGDLFVIRSPAATVDTMVAALELHLGKKLPQKHIGIRPGEKMHEMLLTAEEERRAERMHEGRIEFCRVPRKEAHMNDFYVGDAADLPNSFTSENTRRMDAKETLALMRDAQVLK